MQLYIKEKRTEVGMSLQELSQKTGISENRLQKFEDEVISVDIGQLSFIAKALNLEVSDLFECEDKEIVLHLIAQYQRPKPGKKILDKMSNQEIIELLHELNDNDERLNELINVSSYVCSILKDFQCPENNQIVSTVMRRIYHISDSILGLNEDGVEDSEELLNEFHNQIGIAAKLMSYYSDSKKVYIIVANRMLSWLKLSKSQEEFYAFLRNSNYSDRYVIDLENITIPFLEKIAQKDVNAKIALALIKKDEYNISYIRLCALAILKYLKSKPAPYDMNSLTIV